jgi:hypothetical protein
MRPTRRATRHSAMMLLIPLFALMLMLPPPQGSAQVNHTYREFTTSDEYPPAVCQVGDILGGVLCEGDYCDNVTPLCVENIPQPFPVRREWTPFISEEDPPQLCSGNGFITGLACNGDYCDNISLECTIFRDFAPRDEDCFWTGRISEESGLVNFPAGYYGVGVSCSGSYCDNLSFYLCSRR